MLEKIPNESELNALLGKELYGVWKALCAAIDEKADRDGLIGAIKQADAECGSCGCEFDPLYKRALELLNG